MFKRPLLIVLTLLVFTGCATYTLSEYQLTERYGETLVLDRRIAATSEPAQHFRQNIQPLLENRCVVCHGCYDAPCQLKLSSAAGILRGASQQKVYDGTRILAANPTRMGIDALNTEQWRAKGFFPILNERSQIPQFNQENSSLYQLLALKQQHPLPKDKLLDDDFTLGLDREQSCPTPADIDDYKNENPLWGMPYALPALTPAEHDLLQSWITQGAPMGLPLELPHAVQQQVQHWEAFLNQDDLKSRLWSRYLYEHLFLASLYFSDTPLFGHESETESPAHTFKLVRSATPPGLPIQPIATRRPYDDPGVARVYYRLMPDHSSRLHKTFMPYRLNAERMDWIKQLFVTPDYDVEQWPGYDTRIAANPFLAFQALPVNGRYRFMLQESKFIIQGFIKGPVCRGQVALNVIDDHFWVAFVNPDQQDDGFLESFLVEQSDNLRLPGEAESNAGIMANWIKYSQAHNQYLQAKTRAMRNRLSKQDQLNLDLVWAGDQGNPNAALTVFRHFDSSTVLEGWVGQNPKTLWLVSYPLLERIHYLLVAEFDVYGNIGHQLITRLYMDFLRMEGEANFLALLPYAERQRLTNLWYRDTPERVREHLVNFEKNLLGEPSITYTEAQPKDELIALMKQRFGKSLSTRYTTQAAQTATQKQLNQTLAPLNKVQGTAASLMPELSILMISRDATPSRDTQLVTLVRNTGHSNLNGLLYERLNLLPAEDYLTWIPGVAGAYPSAIYHVRDEQLNDFVAGISSLSNEDDYEALMDQFGVRRTNPDFWQYSDALHRAFEQQEPLDYGLLDYNRLENR